MTEEKSLKEVMKSTRVFVTIVLFIGIILTLLMLAYDATNGFSNVENLMSQQFLQHLGFIAPIIVVMIMLFWVMSMYEKRVR